MEIPRYIYKHKKTEEKILTEGSKASGMTLVSNITSATFDKGIFLNYEGGEYPQKGVVTPEILASVNIMKAVFMSVFNLRPSINSLVCEFNRVGTRILSSYLLKDEYRTSGTMELSRIVENFVKPFVRKEREATRFAEIVTHLIEYDNAYRLRVVDISSETNKEELIKRPRKEINRLLEIIYERGIQFEDVKKKFKYVTFVLKLGLLIPKIKRAFKKAISESDWQKMQYDNIDRYWACLRTDYNFMGMTYEERTKFLKDNNLNAPKQYERRL